MLAYENVKKMNWQGNIIFKIYYKFINNILKIYKNILKYIKNILKI